MKNSINERGQGIAEYAFLISLVVVVIILVLSFFGISVRDMYEGFVPLLVEVFSS